MLKSPDVLRASGVAGYAVLALVLATCSTRQPETENIPVPSAKMAKKSGDSIETLGKGYSLFQTHCGQCHELIMPKDMQVSEWHIITPGMAWNAGLEKNDEKALLAYLVAATRQIEEGKKTQSQ